MPVQKPTQPDTESPAGQTEPTQTDSPILDWDDALERVEGDRDLLNELVMEVVEQLPQQFDTIRDGFSRGDSDAIRQIGHSMKGMAATISAKMVADLAAQIEALARAGRTEGMAELLPDLDRQIDLLCELVWNTGAKRT